MNRMAIVADLATTTALVTIAAIFAGPVLLNGGGTSGQGLPVRAAAAFEVVSIKVNTSGQPVGVIVDMDDVANHLQLAARRRIDLERDAQPIAHRVPPFPTASGRKDRRSALRELLAQLMMLDGRIAL